MSLSAVFERLIHIVGLCPHCGHLFRVADARPHLKSSTRTTFLDRLEREEAKLDQAVELLEAEEVTLRAAARKQGLHHANRKLRSIDRVFSRARLNPHDVKVIFHPVEYVVFDGMNRDKLRRVLLLANEPATGAEEKVSKSIARAVDAGNYDFRTLRVSADGALAMQ